jgi:uncharacterized Ntn-hydrolase superfamily protein
MTLAISAAYERTPGALAFRLVAALEAGQAAGGDKRGKAPPRTQPLTTAENDPACR